MLSSALTTGSTKEQREEEEEAKNEKSEKDEEGSEARGQAPSDETEVPLTPCTP